MRCLLLLTIGLLLTGSVWAGRRHPKAFTLGKHTISLDEGKIKILVPSAVKGGESITRSKIEVAGFNFSLPYKRCPANENQVCLEWGNESSGKFTLKATRKNGECLTVTTTSGPDKPIGPVCHPYGSDQWYGGPERYQQNYPVQTTSADNEPYVTRSANNQGVLEAFWFNSAGSTIYISQQTPLFFDSNKYEEGSLCLSASNTNPYKPRDVTQMTEETCEFGNAVDAYYGAVSQYFGKPTKIPSTNMIKEPIYSTWVRYNIDISQDKLMQFTNEILDHGFPIGQIEIDDKWEPCYGALEFDTNKFPNVTQLTNYIHSKGGRASAWVMPFVNIGCPLGLFEKFRDEGRLVFNENGSALTNWWQGAGGALDLTNVTTRDWFVERLQNLLKTSGLDTYKFDAGETSWLPQLPNLTGDPELYPDFQVRDFAEAVVSLGGDLEIRVGHGTQDIPAFIRMLDRDSHWGLNNGLQSIITTTFTLGLSGYPFVLPDMIGGNAVGGETVSKELFIRWVEANALLPAMQFSILPWDYDNETVAIAKKYLDLHTNYSSVILEAAEQSLIDGRPIITPIWWISPLDPETWPINDRKLSTQVRSP